MPTIRAPRLAAFDYSTAGVYFITLCTWKRRCYLGRLVAEGVRHSLAGLIAREELARTNELRRDVRVDATVIMPDHLHAIIWLAGARPDDRPRSDLTRVVNGIKAAVTKRWRERTEHPDRHLWQPSFYDHALRSAQELAACRAYISQNPARALAKRSTRPG